MNGFVRERLFVLGLILIMLVHSSLASTVKSHTDQVWIKQCEATKSELQANSKLLAKADNYLRRAKQKNDPKPKKYYKTFTLGNLTISLPFPARSRMVSSRDMNGEKHSDVILYLEHDGKEIEVHITKYQDKLSKSLEYSLPKSLTSINAYKTDALRYFKNRHKREMTGFDMWDWLYKIEPKNVDCRNHPVGLSKLNLFSLAVKQSVKTYQFRMKNNNLTMNKTLFRYLVKNKPVLVSRSNRVVAPNGKAFYMYSAKYSDKSANHSAFIDITVFSLAELGSKILTMLHSLNLK